MRADK
ncbi:hypothetical protein YPPY101_1559, partial [Yersinia pestis PY-101]